MRKKKPVLVITFGTTTEAMKMEKFCIQKELPGRLIPVPREITAGCGLAWKTEQDQRALFMKEFQENGITWEGMYDLEL